MAAETEDWILRLVDQSSGTAAKIAAGVGSLDAAQIKAAESAIRLAQAQRSASALAAKAAANPNDAAAQTKAQEAQAKAMLAAAKIKLGGPVKSPLGGVAEDADKLISKKAAFKDVLGGELGNIANAAKAAGGPLGAVASKVEGLAGIIGRVPPQVAVVIVAITALAAVAGAAVVTLYKMAEAAISVFAQRNQLLATFSALGNGAAGGKATLAIVDKLSAQLPFANEKIAQWATGLQKVGLQGRALEQAIKGVAAAQALMGDSGAAAAEALFSSLAKGGAEAAGLIAKIKMGAPEARAQLAEMGLRVEDIAGALGMSVAQFRNARLSAKQMAEAIEKALARKAAGPLADLFLTFPTLITKVKEGFLSLFTKLGPAIRPFMVAVKGLFGEFFKGGGIINALRPIVTAVLTTLFAWATRGVNAIRDIVTWFQKSSKVGQMFGGVVAVLRGVWSAVATVFGIVMKAAQPLVFFIQRLLSNANAMRGIRLVLTALAAAFGVVVVIVAAFVGFMVGLIAVAGGVAAMLADLAAEVIGFGSAIVEGLIGGIDVGAFVERMASMARAGLAAFKAALGIASPSKVMAQMGGYTVAGFEQGVDANAGDAQGAVDRMVTPKRGKAGAGAKDKGGGGLTAQFYNCVFGGDLTQEKVDAMMQSWWDRMAQEQPT